MKQLIFSFGFLFFVSVSSAQVIKRDTVVRKAVPVRVTPHKKPSVKLQAEKKPVLVEKTPALKVEKKATIDAKQIVKSLKYFKATKAGSPAAPGGQRELKTQGSGFRTEDNTEVTIKVRSHTDPHNPKQVCATEKIDNRLSTDDFKSFTIYGPPDWLKPGIILKASSFVQGTEVIEEKYKRSPITISTSARGPIKSRVTVQNPQAKSSINEAVRQLVSQDRSVSGANMTFTYHEIHSQQELNFQMTGRFTANFSSIAAQLGVNSHSEKKVHYYLVEFQQTLFSLEVDGLDKEQVFINNPEVSTENYVYLSKVNYGRRGYFMYISHESLEELDVNASVSASYAGYSGDIKASLNTLQKSKDVEIKAFYYGGTLKSASDDIINTLKGSSINLETYIKASNFSPAEAYPISYELKNLSNQKVGMSSHSIQEVETCVPVKEVLKLKVTLAEIECAATSDRDNLADYTVIQHVLYKTKGKNKIPADKRYSKYGGNCYPGGWTSSWNGSVSLICGSVNKQIHVSEIAHKKRVSSGNNINNYIVFHITPEEANDANAEFLIRTYVRENNSSNDIRLNYDNEVIEVAIKDVLAILSGAKSFPAGSAYSMDGQVDQSLKFDYFGGMKMPLTKVPQEGKIVALEGPIRARNSGHDLTDKAFLWVRFELVD